MLSLREARMEDHWRTAYKRKYPIRINQIECSEGIILDGLKIELKQGINAIIGKNGIGKSNYIRAIFNCFASNYSNRKKFQSLLNNSVFHFDLEVGSDNFNLTVKPSDGLEDTDSIVGYVYDPCSLIPSIQEIFSQQNNLEELLESFARVVIGSDELKIINYLTNSDYEKVTMINIEDEFDNFPILPFFEVETSSAKYDSTSMGLGELSLFYLFWLLNYIEKKGSPIFLLVEEPESFIPPLVQQRVSNILAMAASTNGVTIIISSHSEHILKKIPRTHIHILKNINGRCEFQSASSELEQLKVLGLSCPKVGVLLYEDDSSGLFLRSLIKKSSKYVCDSFSYKVSGSEGDILKDLERFPLGVEELLVLGIFDGDSRKRHKEIAFSNNFIFLPTDNPPEIVLIDFIKQYDAQALANILSVDVGTLSTALDSIAGSDHHDYFHGLASMIDIDYQICLSILFDNWVKHEANISLVENFINELEGL